jgi:hypothetical protein
MPARQTAPCFRCREMIEINEAAFVADIRLRLVGLDDALRMPQMSVSVCINCADLIAKGDEPNPQSRPLDYAFCKQIQEAVASDPTFSFLSWIQLRKTRGMAVPSLPEIKAMRSLNDLRQKLSLPSTLEGGEGKSGLVKVAG